MQNKSRKFLKLLFVAITLTMPSQGVLADTFTWVGGTSNDVNTPENWLPNNVPQTGDTADFTSTGNPTPALLTGTFSPNLLDFASGAQSYTFTVNAAAAIFGGTGVQNQSGPQVFDILNGAQMTFQNQSSADVSQSKLITYNLSNSSFNLSGQSNAGGATINANNASTINLSGSAKVTNALLTAKNNSSIVFNSTSQQANIIQLQNSTLNILGSKLTLNSLTTDASSHVFLNDHPLTINYVGSSPITIAGSISSATGGSLIKDGVGTLRLSGVNTYNNGTVIKNGVLEIKNIQSLPASNGVDIQGNGSLLFSCNGLYKGIITGNGDLLKSGLGTLILDQPNYLGPTTIESGKLQFDNTPSSPTITLQSTSSIVGFDQHSGVGSYSGTITGKGNVEINATSGDKGTVILTGTNTYSGLTTVFEGTLEGSSISLPGNIVDKSAVIFNQPVDGKYQGTISGSGTLTKIGVGDLNFSGDSSSFTGKTEIKQGDLSLNNTLGGALDVFASGRLSGNGTILGNVHVNTAGRISPGNGTGTINVGGNYRQRIGSIYEVEIDENGRSSLIHVAGNALIDHGAKVHVAASDFQLPPFETFSVPIIHADGFVIGRFHRVDRDNLLITSFLRYDAHNVYLHYQNTLSLIETFSPNQYEVLTQLQTIQNPSANENALLVALIEEDPNRAVITLDQLSAQQYTNLLLAAEVASRQFIRKLYDPVRELGASNPSSSCYCDDVDVAFDMWSQVSGNESTFEGNRNASQFKMSGYEAVIGAQVIFDQSFAIGSAFSYEVDHLDFKIGGSGKNQVVLGGVYSLYRNCGYYLMGDIVLGYSQDRVNRTVKARDLLYVAKSRPKVFQETLYLEGGLDYNWRFVTVQPFLGFEIGNYRHKKINEYNADPINVTVNKRSHTNAYGSLGMHFTTKKRPQSFSLGLDIAWQYRVTQMSNNIKEQFVSFGSPFVIKGFAVPKYSFEGRARVAKEFCGWEFFAEVEGQSWFSGFSYGISGGAQFDW